MKLYLVTAISENRVIGKGGLIPWHIPPDLKWFNRLTTGHTVLMGRKTYESMGKILPDRENIIITRKKNYKVEGARVFHSLRKALNSLKKEEKDKVFIIGGEEIYRATIGQAERLYITLVHISVEGDTYFPAIPERKFQEVFREEHREYPTPFSFIIFERI